MELSTKEFAINGVLRTGVDVKLDGGIGPVNTRNLERVLGATFTIVCLNTSFADGKCQVSNSAVAVLCFNEVIVIRGEKRTTRHYEMMIATLLL